MHRFGVPNPPCGVESGDWLASEKHEPLFLIHRVELKDGLHNNTFCSFPVVPNPPCGVERPFPLAGLTPLFRFLIHRVELKVIFAKKEGSKRRLVSNPPCGVESRRF